MKDFIIWGINNMKKNKKRLLISTLVLFVIWSCVTIYIVFNDKRGINEEKVLGFESVTVINNINVSVGENFYVKDEGNKLVIYDFNDNIISEYTEEFTNYEIFDKRFIIVTNKNIKKIKKQFRFSYRLIELSVKRNCFLFYLLK